VPYSIRKLLDAFGPAPPRHTSSLELGDLNDGKIIKLPDDLKAKLALIGDPAGEDRSKQDFALLCEMTKHIKKDRNLYATFAASPRGQDALTRKNGHFDDYMRRTLAAVRGAKANELTKVTIADRSDFELAASAENWRDYFFTGDELDRTPLEFVVDRLIPEQGITGFGGLSGTAKTYIMMSIAKRILTGGFLWDRFKTNQYKVLYLIPESASGPFYERMVRLRIPTNKESFLVRTLSHGPTLPLSSEVMKGAVKGRVVFLDTLIRFMDGKVEQAATDMAMLGDSLLSLLRCGAVGVVFAHHAIKSQDNELTLENAFRGSGDIGAILSAAHAVAQLDPDKSKTLIQVQCVKARDFDARLPFQLQGKPYINRSGDFKLVKLPGECHSIQGEKRVVRNETAEAEITKIMRLLRQGKSQRDIEGQLGVSHNSDAYKEARKRFKAKEGRDSKTSKNDEDLGDISSK